MFAIVCMLGSVLHGTSETRGLVPHLTNLIQLTLYTASICNKMCMLDATGYKIHQDSVRWFPDADIDMPQHAMSLRLVAQVAGGIEEK